MGWLAIGLAAVAAGCLALAVASPGSVPRAVAAPPKADPVASSRSTPSATSSSGASGTATTAPVPPVRISIPVLHLVAPVDELGLQDDLTVEVPEDPMRTGWYRMGTAPGQPGSAVILGHVDSTAGTAVFARLHDLRPGDLVIVSAADGTSSTFRVIRLSTYPNAEFPAAEVYAAPGPEHRLNLVTCGGKYTRATGHQANLVVYTRLVPGPSQPAE
jgi:sortase (surface protein transpeptidase)